MSGQAKLPDSSVAPHSLVDRSLDDLRNVKGRPMFGVAFWVPFLLHLWRRDGAACMVATCHVLIGWMWAHSLTRHLVFLHHGFWGSL